MLSPRESAKFVAENAQDVTINAEGTFGYRKFLIEHGIWLFTSMYL